MDIKRMMEDVTKNAAAHGFTSVGPALFCEKMLLIVSEISEALEEFRDGRGLTEVYFNPDKPTKPEGIPIELADAVIRILEYAESNGIDLENALELKMEYNRTRTFKHGKAL